MPPDIGPVPTAGADARPGRGAGATVAAIAATDARTGTGAGGGAFGSMIATVCACGLDVGTIGGGCDGPERCGTCAPYGAVFVCG
jgi:hypothetical protein